MSARVVYYVSRKSSVWRPLRPADKYTHVGELTDENTKNQEMLALVKSKLAIRAREVDDLGL